MPELVATRRLTYATRRLTAGDTFNARSERHARVLVAIKKARRPGVESETVDPTPVGDVKSLREKYTEVVGSRPFMGWDAETLAAKIAEAAEAKAT